MEKAPTESNLSITSNDINIELSKEFLVELRKNIYHGTYNEDAVDHIAKVLEMVDLIYIPGVDSHQLRMKVFPLSLADDAKECCISERDGKITTWKELVEKFFCKFYPESYDGEEEMLDEGDNWGIDPHEFISRRRMDDGILNNNNTTTDSFFKPYLITHGKCNTEKEDEQSQTKHKYSNTSESIDEQPNKRILIMEYLVNISKRHAFWSLNEDILKINNSDYQYAISIKEDMAYPCLHSPKTTKETSSICRNQRRPILCMNDIVCEDSGRYQKELQEVMAEPIFDNMEKAPTESNLYITSNDINIELSKEFLVELRKNIYHGTYNEDMVDHIAKVLEMVDLIYIPGVDSHQL
ncbi:hypothetical protein Tco_0705483 [Tanacetum coccineum]|uniref:Uncharacterized protein n=1 Tax=Tanacetum coccineum TaxID=301880 RepID=A0ABQ4Y6S0_9ASTR